MQIKSRFKIARRILIFWTLFIGIGAVAGALGMLTDPTGKNMGMDAMLPYFQVLPFADIVFQDFRFSGWALLIVNGLSNLTAAGLLFAKKAVRRGARRHVWCDTDALDLHSVLYVPAEFHVHNLLHFRCGAGYHRIRGMDI